MTSPTIGIRYDLSNDVGTTGLKATCCQQSDNLAAMSHTDKNAVSAAWSYTSMPAFLNVMRATLWSAGFYGVLASLYLPAAFAGNGSWAFEIEDRGHPSLVYSENGKSVFTMGCGRAFGVHAVYPGGSKKAGERAAITISAGTTTIKLAGEIASTYDDDPPNTIHFVQWDLGFSRQDPEAFGRKWKKLEFRLFDLLDSGQPLTIAGGGKKYVLPAVKVSEWKRRFKDRC